MQVILIDGKNAMYRYGWVHRFLAASDGTLTGACYGLVAGLLRLKRKYPCAKFAVVWDGKDSRSGWRFQFYDGYKAGRTAAAPSPETRAVLSQIPLVKKLLKMLCIPQVEINELEADDVLGIFAAQCIRKGWQPIIYSSDKDFMQLMRYNVLVIRDVDKKRELEPENTDTVFKQFRCSPSQLLHLRAVLGDPSDCIPRAVKGVGEVAAAAMVAAGLDTSFPSFDSLPPHVQRACAKLAKGWDAVRRNYALMQIPTSIQKLPATAAVRDALIKQLMGALHVLESSEAFGEEDYDSLIALLGKLELREAIRHRQDLIALQQIS